MVMGVSDKARKTKRETANLRKKRNRKWFASKKADSECSECGFDHPASIDFHHRKDEIKEFSISDGVQGQFSIERLEKEIAKCRALCSNCHRILHYERSCKPI